MKYTNQRLARDYLTDKKYEIENSHALANCRKIANKIGKCRTDIPGYYHNNGNLSGLKENFGRDTKKYLEGILSQHVSKIKIEKGIEIEILPTFGPKEDFW